VSKSFLEPLGMNGFSKATKLLTEEFIDGVKSGQIRSEEELAIIEGLTSKMTEYYNWDKSKSILENSSQKCQDMLVHVGSMKNIFNIYLM